MTSSDRPLTATAQGQHGAFLIEQAHRSGIPDHVLRGWISSGLLEQFGARTLRSTFTNPAPADDAGAMLLDIRPKGWLARSTAAAIQGIEPFELGPPYHVLLPRGAYATRPGLVVHTSTTTQLSDRVFVDGLPVTNPVRTLIDLASTCSAKTLTVALDGALRDRLLTEEGLLARIAELRTQGRYGIPKLLAVIEGVEASRGGHSWLERRFLELIAEAGLPRPEVQRHMGRVDGRMIRVDCCYRDVGVIVELLGYRWHRSRAQMNRDAQRINRLSMDGWIVLQFTYDRVVKDPAGVVADVLEARFRRLCQSSG